MMMKTSTVRTWRERLGRGQDFPLHAPTDVERAMEAQIAELQAALAAAEAPSSYKPVGKFLYVGMAYEATSSDDPRGITLYRMETCAYPKCNCPFDAPSDPDWCARGLPKGGAAQAQPKDTTDTTKEKA